MEPPGPVRRRTESRVDRGNEGTVAGVSLASSGLLGPCSPSCPAGSCPVSTWVLPASSLRVLGNPRSADSMDPSTGRWVPFELVDYVIIIGSQRVTSMLRCVGMWRTRKAWTWFDRLSFRSAGGSSHVNTAYSDSLAFMQNACDDQELRSILPLANATANWGPTAQLRAQRRRARILFASGALVDAGQLYNVHGRLAGGRSCRFLPTGRRDRDGRGARVDTRRARAVLYFRTLVT